MAYPSFSTFVEKGLEQAYLIILLIPKGFGIASGPIDGFPAGSVNISDFNASDSVLDCLFSYSSCLFRLGEQNLAVLTTFQFF